MNKSTSVRAAPVNMAVLVWMALVNSLVNAPKSSQGQCVNRVWLLPVHTTLVGWAVAVPTDSVSSTENSNYYYL